MNSNSRTGRRGSKMNCSLIAMDNLGIKADKTFYRHGYGMWDSDVVKTVNKQKRTRLFFGPTISMPIRNLIQQKHPTTIGFARKHPKGLFLIFVNYHVGVIDNGKLYNLDTLPRIRHAYKVPR